MKWDIFSSENLLMSVGGHLALAAVMVTSLALVMDRATLVAPDRIEITEIDLSQVKVSGEETKLYNTDVPAAPEPVKEKPAAADPAPVPAPAPTENVKEATAPTLAEPESVPEKKKAEEPTPAPESDATPAPKKKTVVRVNRETVSLDRTLTISVIDALRVAMTRCWSIDTTRPDIQDIRAVAHLTMNKNGTVRDVWFESAARAEEDTGFAYVLETIRRAIDVCQPFSMLPENEFQHWEKIQLTFYPTQGKVM